MSVRPRRERMPGSARGRPPGVGGATPSCASPGAALALAILALIASACGSGSEGEGGAGGDTETIGALPGASLYRLPDTPSGELLARAIAFHDPDAVWRIRPLEVRWESSRPGGERRIAEIGVDNRSGFFDLEMELRGHVLELDVSGDTVHTRVNGSEEFTPEVRERLRLHREGGLYWRNYFLFLLGMPMKLTDPGTELGAEPRTADFQGRRTLALRARYETEDGYPWWEFYFDPTDARLVGARFWREAPDADGEYIVMEELAEAGSLRLPAVRRWYTNAEGEHLGTDRVARLEAGER